MVEPIQALISRELDRLHRRIRDLTEERDAAQRWARAMVAAGGWPHNGRDWVLIEGALRAASAASGLRPALLRNAIRAYLDEVFDPDAAAENWREIHQ